MIPTFADRLAVCSWSLQAENPLQLIQHLRAIGAEADELPAGFVVHGARRALKGAVKTYGDHRIAMAFGVLGALPGNEIVIDDPDCVGVSFPGFWVALQRLASS